MRKLVVPLCLLAAAVWLMPALAQSQVLDHKTFSIISGAGQTGDGKYTSDMFYDPNALPAGSECSWSGGAAGIQGGSSQTCYSRLAAPVYAVPANVTFKFDVGSTVDALNAQYGAGNWTIANPTLYIQYTLYANNNRFGAGAGTFDIFWVANDAWYQDNTDCSHNPLYASTAAALTAWSGTQALLSSQTYTWSTPNYTGTYNDLGTSTWQTDKGGGRQSTVTYNLALDPLLVNDVVSASAANNPNVSLYLMATSPTMGMTLFTGGGSVLPSFGFDVVPATAPPAGSHIRMSPTTWTYNPTIVNNVSGAQQFTVTSYGQSPCTVSTLSLTGTNTAEFAIVSGTDTCSGRTLVTGESCSVDIAFAPTTAGDKSAVLNIPSDSADNTNFTVALSGYAPASALWVVPTTSYDYGSVLVGYSASKIFTVTNSGSTTITIGIPTIAGSASGEFVKGTGTDDTCSGTALTPGATCSVAVSFVPAWAGSKSASLTIPSDDVQTPNLSVALSGTAIVAAGFTLAPSGTVTYPPKNIDEQSGYEKQTITVTSIGSIDLHISGIVLDDNTNYTITSDGCSNHVMAHSATCTFEVQFNPTSAGVKAANAVITSNAGNTNGTTDKLTLVPLSGKGIGYVTIAPRSLDFGVVLLPDGNQGGATANGCTDNGNGTVSCAVTITNTNDSSIDLTLSVPPAGSFTVNPTTIASLASGAATGAVVTYTTGGTSANDADTLTVSAGGHSDSIALKAVTNTRPATPVNNSPGNGASGIAAPVQLAASAFSDPDGDAWKSATWEISTRQDFASGSVVFTSPDVPAELGDSLTVPPGILMPLTTYYWRVSYRDARNAPSLSSAPTSFTTAGQTMNESGTIPAGLAVTDGSNEVTALSGLGASGVNYSQRLIDDLGSTATVNSGSNADTGKASLVIVKENGDSASKDVIGIVTPAGTKLEAVTTTDPADRTLLPEAPPTNYALNNGLVTFRLSGITQGAATTVTIYTPSDLPQNAVWYKYSPSLGWLRVVADGVYDTSGTRISSGTRFTVTDGKGVLTITDDDTFTDASREVITGKAVIIDPGGPAEPVESPDPDVTPTPSASDTPPAGGGGGGGGCFIATAAFGSYFDPYVMVLREFRDAFLLTSRPGRAFVRWYYRTSPSIADTIRTSEVLKAGVRGLLMPLVCFSALCLTVGFPAAVVLLLAGLCLPISVILIAGRLRRRGPAFFTRNRMGM
jgi:hypothetical protein